MLSQHQNAALTQETLFATICRLVEERNEIELKKIIKSGASINLVQGEYTPVMYFAHKGNIDAVEFLLNKFAAPLTQAVFGFALGDHVNEVDKRISQENDPDKRYQLLKEAIWGYAHSNNIIEVKKILSDEKDPHKLYELRQNALRGFARGGHSIPVRRILFHETNPGRLNELRADAIFYFSAGGYFDEVYEICMQEKDESTLWMFRKDFVSGSALGGHITKVQDILYQEKDPHKLLELRKEAMLFFAYGGYFNTEEVQAIYAQEKNPSYLRELKQSVVEGLARGGDTKQIREIFKQETHPERLETLRKIAVSNSILADHFKIVKELYSQVKDESDKLNDLKVRAVYWFASGGHVIQVKEILSQETNDPEWLEIFQRNALAGYINGGSIDHAQTMISDEEDPNKLQKLTDQAIRSYAYHGYVTPVYEKLSQELREKTAKCFAANEYYNVANGNRAGLLFLMSHINDRDLRVLLIQQVKNGPLTTDESLRKIFLRSANELNQLMTKHQYDYDEARCHFHAWKLLGQKELSITMHHLFFQCIQPVEEKKISLDLCIQILSFVIEQSYEDTWRLFYNHLEVVPKELYEFSIDTISNDNSLAPHKTEELKEQAKARYHKRIACAGTFPTLFYERPIAQTEPNKKRKLPEDMLDTMPPAKRIRYI